MFNSPHLKNVRNIKQDGVQKITAELDTDLLNSDISERNTALSLGMAALNETNGALIVERRKEAPLDKEVRQYFKNNISKGLTSALAGVGLQSAEKSVVKGDLNRAVDRLMELYNGYQPSVGYPLDALKVAGGHLLSRKWSNEIGVPDQIIGRHNMEFEGDIDNSTRGEHRGKFAADLQMRRFYKYLEDSNLSPKEINNIKYTIDNLGTTPDWS